MVPRMSARRSPETSTMLTVVVNPWKSRIGKTVVARIGGPNPPLPLASAILRIVHVFEVKPVVKIGVSGSNGLPPMETAV
jgi:hypothetical protein